jgi:hypothetical protein
MSFQRPEVAVYFPAPTRKKPIPGPHQRAQIITTWNRSYRTAAGIGPCSTLAAAQSAYGARWKPSSHGIVLNHTHGLHSAYVVGNNLIFAMTADGRTIIAVGLYEGGPHAARNGSPQSYANFITSNQSACE